VQLRHARSCCIPGDHSVWAQIGALYFVLAGMLGRFRYLNVGLAAVLVFVGLKMSLVDLYEVPAFASLAIIAALLAAAVGVSLLRPAPVIEVAPERPAEA
jgi:tellurite resistance protein TerC